MIAVTLALIGVGSTASAELVGSAGQCGIPTPSPITLPQIPTSGNQFPIWVCPDIRSYPDGFITSVLPVIDSVVIVGNTIQVEVSSSEVSIFSGVLPRYWQVLTTVPLPGKYNIEYYTILRANPGVGTAGEPRTLRAVLPITVGVSSPTSIPVMSSTGVFFALACMIIFGAVYMNRRKA